MHPGVAKINVHQIGAAAFQQAGEKLVLAAIDNRGAPFHEFQPAMPKGIKMRHRDELDVIERKPVGVLHFLRHDEGADLAQARDLPVNMKHLRLQKCCAVTCDDQFRHKKLGNSKSGSKSRELLAH